ncbi:unnamed protein product [Trifolium pratense]|uniref:Uncharacterized protein n=1 Tax=Trifolium pratense TaxID=57577 RepID=A0ACB0JZD1_TRIPR|nr:unnamed protein product [Trifolium pratense]
MEVSMGSTNGFLTKRFEDGAEKFLVEATNHPTGLETDEVRTIIRNSIKETLDQYDILISPAASFSCL